MDSSLDDILAELQIYEEAQSEPLSEDFSLEQLRLKRGVTQVQMAKRLGKAQSTIARIEKNRDNLLSTLEAYVEALGGKLSFDVEFPNYISGLLAVTLLNETQKVEHPRVCRGMSLMNKPGQRIALEVAVILPVGPVSALDVAARCGFGCFGHPRIVEFMRVEVT